MLDYSSILSKKVMDIKPSGIRKYFDLVESMDGVISLGVGEPDFKTPWIVRQAAIENLENAKTTYTSNAGLADLRQEISRYLNRKFDLNYDDKSEIVVTVGGSEAIDLSIRALINPGDEVLIPEPCFVAYAPIATLCGAKVVPIETYFEDDFRLTAKMLKSKITSKTKLLIFPFPNNPTGAVMRKEHLEEIAEVLRDTNILVLSDEIYAELTYSAKHISIATIDGMRERTIIVNGFSKAYSMTGWRLGYACGPKEIMSQLLKIHQYAIMCSPTTSQYAGIVALSMCDDEISQMRDEYDMRRRFLADGLKKIGLECFIPDGAFYIFPCIKSTGLSSEEFCEKLLMTTKVAIIPGTAFGQCGEGYARISYSYNINHLAEALNRMEKFMNDLNKRCPHAN